MINDNSVALYQVKHELPRAPVSSTSIAAIDTIEIYQEMVDPPMTMTDNHEVQI